VNLSEPTSPPSKKALILRLVLIVTISFAIAELTDVTIAPFHSHHPDIINLIENAIEIGLLFIFIYHFVTKPMFKEISRRIAIEDLLRKTEATNRSILDALPDTILRISRDGTLIDYRLETEGVMNVGIGNHINDMFPESAVQEIMNCQETARTSGMLQKLDILLPDGSDELHQELRFVKFGNDEVLIIISNITDRKMYEEKLKYVSTHDSLTGLYNRAFYETQLERLGKGRHYPIGIIVIDLDGLKNTNDTFGHAAGDRMICKAADVLKMAFRADDLVARTGGDEFTILLTETDYHSLQLVLNRIKSYLDDANSVETTFELRFSLGSAIADSNDKFQDAVRMADMRMYEDKAIRKAAMA